VLGLLVDIGGTMLFSTVMAFVAGIALAAGGTPPEQAARLIETAPGFQLLGLAGGLSCTALGGYVAARFANHSEYANAFAVGVASLVFGETVITAFGHDLPLWLRLLGDLLVVPAALLGGHLRALQTRAVPAA